MKDSRTTPGPSRSAAVILWLIQPFWPLMAISMTMGIISGVAVTSLLAVVNEALHADHLTRALVFGFAGLCVLALVGEIASDIGNSLVGQRIVARLREDLTRKILSAPIAEIERYKVHRLIVTLNQDVDMITTVSFNISSVAIAVAVCVGCLTYLASLSLSMLMITLIAVVTGIGVQSLLRSRGRQLFDASRDAEDQLQKHYAALTEGAKELRINRQRRRQLFHKGLLVSIHAIRDLTVRATNLFVTANAFAAILFFLVVGVLLVLRDSNPAYGQTVVSGFVLVLLYMRGSIQTILGALPMLARAQVSFARVADLEQRFASIEPEILADDEPEAAHPTQGGGIELHEVVYRFAASEAGAAPFELGPINLEIRPGEILFIVGENGCGKTTLIKLLLGLYRPSAGQLRVDGKPVEPADLDEYRQRFSAVFTDYHLFESLALNDPALAQLAQHYLSRLQIAHKVRIVAGGFSTTDLSTGQRKRLALVHAYLENRPVMVFDEWAADQDPTFRRVFYTEILPELKRAGKTIIVISHDDRYFDACDRYLRLDGGRIVEEVAMQNPVARSLVLHDLAANEPWTARRS